MMPSRMNPRRSFFSLGLARGGGGGVAAVAAPEGHADDPGSARTTRFPRAAVGGGVVGVGGSCIAVSAPFEGFPASVRD